MTFLNNAGLIADITNIMEAMSISSMESLAKQSLIDTSHGNAMIFSSSYKGDCLTNSIALGDRSIQYILKGRFSSNKGYMKFPRRTNLF